MQRTLLETAVPVLKAPAEVLQYMLQQEAMWNCAKDYAKGKCQNDMQAVVGGSGITRGPYKKRVAGTISPDKQSSCSLKGQIPGRKRGVQ